MTADEAKALMPVVLGELEGAWGELLSLVQDPPVGLVQMVKDRYEAGCEEFKGDWTTKDCSWCTENAKEELADLWVYLAFRRVLRTRALSSVSPSHQSIESPE